MLGRLILLASVVLLLASCAADAPTEQKVEAVRSTSVSPQPSAPGTTGETPLPAADLPEGVSEPPSWLGQRPLPLDGKGFGVATDTPKVLQDRRFVTADVLPPPDDDGFLAGIEAVPDEVLRRSTWKPSCPVKRSDLSYLKMTFWGFDEKPHTGEMIVNNRVAADVISVFQTLYRNQWPIEEMRVTRADELKAPPTGDGNNTSAFVCRDARLNKEWSEHAYGLAVDVNPFHNPYVRGKLTLPELAIAYRDRGWHRPGMIRAGDVVTDAFATIGWGWGGDWNSSKDWMHFSRTGE